MKKIRFLCAAFTIAGSMAYAQNNEVFITQLDENNEAFVYVGMDGGSASEGLVEVTQDGESNLVYVNQGANYGLGTGGGTSIGNSLEITQTGSGSQADIRQGIRDGIAENSAAFIDQMGEGVNSAVIVQGLSSASTGGSYGSISQNSASGSLAIIVQGAYNFSQSENDMAEITQIGNNTAYIYQGLYGGYTFENSAIIDQDGTTNSARIEQAVLSVGAMPQDVPTTYNSSAMIYQEGDSNFADIVQFSGFNTAEIFQDGDMNSAEMIQGGVGNTYVIDQVGTGQNATINIPE